MNEELGAYLEMEAAEKMKQGMSRKDALRAVRFRARKPRNYEGSCAFLAAGNPLVDTLWRDLLFAVRNAPQEFRVQLQLSSSRWRLALA